MPSPAAADDRHRGAEMSAPIPDATGAAARMRGFTLVELVMVIAIVAIVTAIGVSGRFVDRSAFEARGFAPQLSQYIAAGQRIAVAQRRTVHVAVDTAAGRIRLCLDAACTQPVPAAPRLSPSDPDWLQLPPTLRVATTSTAFSFSSDGTPSFAATASLRLTDAAGNDLGAGTTIEAGSGHVRAF
jgi:prepilin-type N-terminal cleavage/methylation domain-containing protein